MAVAGGAQPLTSEPYTTTGALAAVASPVWLPKLHTISIIAAEALPILGATWLIVQIVIKIYVTIRNRKATENGA